MILREEGWDPVIKIGGLIQLSERGGLGSSYQDRRVDLVIKRGGLESSYQERRAGIQLSREQSWDLVIREEG